MKRSDELLGLVIYSISEGIEVGRSRDLIINAAAGQVEGFIVQDQRWMEGIRVLPFSLVEGIGEQAITIEHSSSVQGISELPEIASYLSTNIRIRGTKVITRNGAIRGIVNEFLVDTTNGMISGCEVHSDEASSNSFFVEVNNVVTFGRDALVIRDTDDSSPSSPRSHTSPAEDRNSPTSSSVQTECAVNVPETTMEDAAGAAERDELTGIFDKRQIQFLLGKRCTRRIESDLGVVLVEEGDMITEEIISRLKLAGKYIELTMSI